MLFKRFWQKRYNLSHDNNNGDWKLKSLEEICLFLESTASVRFKGANRLSKYNWIEETLKRLKYYSLNAN